MIHAPTWAAAQLLALPQRWADQLATEWRRYAKPGQHRNQLDQEGADRWLSRRLGELEEGRKAGITPRMGESDLCKLADLEARDHADRQATIAGDWAHKGGDIPGDMLAQAIADEQKADAMAVMTARGLADMWPDGPTMTDAGRLARLRDPAFWRRVFRRAHALTVEACAIRLGLVNGRADAYVSRESLDIAARRAAANAAMLRATIAVSERGDEMSLFDIAEKSVSNPTIRRGELMTRVAGFELCADELGHVKRWAVLTCPSRMHKFTHLKTGQAIENKKFDGTTPREAQRYLATQWRRVCAWWERQGLRVYGFRTTEPHQDGTPHWNVLCFFAPLTARVQLARLSKIPAPAVAVFDAGLRRYFLDNDSATERGAADHRVKVQAIDNSKGSAAAYIAKYISKGIDGAGLDLDIFGQPIERTSRAVVAWSRVWGIRQFQQIGGPPVTVWRELRRVNPDNVGSERETADTLRAAIGAVNIRLDEPEAKQASAWQRYTTTQGGPTCKRAAWRVRMHREATDKLNRYGEPSAAHVVGVWAAGYVAAPVPAHLVAMGKGQGGGFRRPALTAIESERCAWIAVQKGSELDAYREHCDRLESGIAGLKEAEQRATLIKIERLQKRRQDEARLREALAPWTRVNNCTVTPTLDTLDRSAMDVSTGRFAPLKRRRRKLDRRYRWENKAGGPSTERTT